MEEPEQTIMRTSLSRPQQLLGGDRELVILSGLGAAIMAAIARRLNRIFRLGSSWMIQVDSFRTYSSGYSPDGAFPDHVTALIDRERREQFGKEGSHFENEYFLALTYMPPIAATEKLRGF